MHIFPVSCPVDSILNENGNGNEEEGFVDESHAFVSGMKGYYEIESVVMHL